MIFTDAYDPQINGVVTTLKNVIKEIEKFGHEPVVIHPGLFLTIPTMYPGVRLALATQRKVKALFKKHQPDAIHIATEGPIGNAARKMCVKHNIPFNTSYHTNWSKYLKAFKIPEWLSWRFLKNFHKNSNCVLVTTPGVKNELDDKGFKNTFVWGRGVDADLFNPDKKQDIFFPKPVLLCVSRISKEKGLEDFLELDIPGTKLVVGDGPDLKKLKEKYKGAHFIGMKTGNELAKFYASADVFVFPSVTDTFGVVMLEAMSSGIPVAAYPTSGPIDVVADGITGYCNYNLGTAISKCLDLDRSLIRPYALEKFSWKKCTGIFVDKLVKMQ